jgi:hypothetical protein
MDRLLAKTRGGDLARDGILAIGKSEFLRTRKLRLAGLETPERSEPSIWKDAWQRIGHRRHCIHREIRDLDDKRFVYCEIAIRETPISGEQLSA